MKNDDVVALLEALKRFQELHELSLKNRASLIAAESTAYKLYAKFLPPQAPASLPLIKPDVNALLSGLSSLNSANILTHANGTALVGCRSNVDNVAQSLIVLSERDLLNQGNFDALIGPGDYSEANLDNITSKIIRQKEEQISMRILSGFITALGLAAVAIAFLVLNAATFGIPGIVVAGIGIGLALGGIGLFATTTRVTKTMGKPVDQPDSYYGEQQSFAPGVYHGSFKPA